MSYQICKNFLYFQKQKLDYSLPIFLISKKCGQFCEEVITYFPLIRHGAHREQKKKKGTHRYKTARRFHKFPNKD
jgi:hypothetical protein